MPEAAPQPGLRARIARLAAWAQRLRPVRAAMHYGQVQGPVLGSGMAFAAVFAVFAGLWVGFSVAGLVLAGDIGLRTTLIDFLDESVPGLIDTGDGDGVIRPEDLLRGQTFGWTGALALVGLVITATNWFGAARGAVRAIFELPPSPTNLLLLRARDLALGVAFGFALLVTALLSVAGTAATGWLLDVSGVGADSPTGAVLGRVVTLGVMFALDAVALGTMYRVLAGVRIPWSQLRQGALLGALVVGTLKVLGSLLLGGASHNPLLASFAVFVGLMVWLNLISQGILYAASWMAVSLEDRDLVLDPRVREERLEEARALLDQERERMSRVAQAAPDGQPADGHPAEGQRPDGQPDGGT